MRWWIHFEIDFNLHNLLHLCISNFSYLHFNTYILYTAVPYFGHANCVIWCSVRSSVSTLCFPVGSPAWMVRKKCLASKSNAAILQWHQNLFLSHQREKHIFCSIGQQQKVEGRWSGLFIILETVRPFISKGLVTAGQWVQLHPSVFWKV